MPKFLTTKEFIEKAKVKHGSLYNYSQVNYSSCKEKVDIICSEHGVFQQIPNSHLNGAGCRLCADELNTISKKEILLRFNEVHKNKYDYSSAVYTNTKGSIDILCPEHGLFNQKVGGHLNGHGCPKCSKYRGLGLERWLETVKKVHGDRYSYDKSIYINYYSKIKIGCKEHGYFEQIAGEHAAGSGCKKCSWSNNKKTTEQWIDEATSKYGTHYDYSLVEYKGANEYLNIKCPVHGLFKQKPSFHLKTGCRKCAVTSDTSSFIEKAEVEHGYKYDYSLVEYVDSRTPVCIVCPEHGFYYSTPSSHLQGTDCRVCSTPSRLIGVNARWYYVRFKDLEGNFLYKIGVTTKEINRRFRDDMSKIEVVYLSDWMSGEKAYQFEQEKIKDHSNWLYTGVRILSRAGVGKTGETFTYDILGLDNL